MIYFIVLRVSFALVIFPHVVFCNNMRKIKVHKDAETVLISGFDPSTEVEDKTIALKKLCSNLHCYIHDVTPRNEPKISSKLKLIVNKSKKYYNIDPHDIRELHEILDKMDLRESGIQQVIFAHSLGAKLFFDAMTDESLATFFKNKYRSDCNIKERIQNIRDRIAIFTLGGVKDIPENFAKVVRNFFFEGDFIADIGKVFIRMSDLYKKFATPPLEERFYSAFDTYIKDKNMHRIVISTQESMNHIMGILPEVVPNSLSKEDFKAGLGNTYIKILDRDRDNIAPPLEEVCYSQSDSCIKDKNIHRFVMSTQEDLDHILVTLSEIIPEADEKVEDGKVYVDLLDNPVDVSRTISLAVLSSSVSSASTYLVTQRIDASLFSAAASALLSYYLPKAMKRHELIEYVESEQLRKRLAQVLNLPD